MSARNKLFEDHDRFRFGLPADLETYVLETYGLDLTSSYGRIPIKNPFGKASGQLSLNLNQIERDVEAGLGFIVLKTVIAQNAQGDQAMKAWAIPATKMTVEPIIGTRPNVFGEEGWTVSWKGRGWSDSFEKYLELVREGSSVAKEKNALVVPSCKYHLPTPKEQTWKEEEYQYTTKKLLDAYADSGHEIMPIEKDFSPTLAGDESFSSQKAKILEWLRTAPALIHKAANGRSISIGLKIFNAGFEDEFQLQMLQECTSSEVQPDYLVYGNRLFDPHRSYEDTQGIAYGGPDLSDRNLQILSRFSLDNHIPISATGNITTGEMAFRYLTHGATSFQMHTLFQLPDTEFTMKSGTRTERALHRLLFHPRHGFLTMFLAAKEMLSFGHPITIQELQRLLHTAKQESVKLESLIQDLIERGLLNMDSIS